MVKTMILRVQMIGKVHKEQMGTVKIVRRKIVI